MTPVETRILVGSFLGALLAIGQWVETTYIMDSSDDGRQASPFLPPMGLLIGCFGVFLLTLLVRSIPVTASVTWSAFVLLQAGAYYTLLLVLHPLLRRTVSGRGRAVLWLLPNVRYYCRYFFIDSYASPRWVIPVRHEWLIVLLTFWLCGAVLVLLIQIHEHDCFRREILQNAYEPPAEALAILRSEEKKLCQKREHTLVISPDVKTPLSIGLFRKSLRIVLPEWDYSEEELVLILRHELVHIRRCDNQAKLFLGICTALSWFNPFVWLSRRCACEDFESGCDELVLSGAEPSTRRLYAGLILDTAADTRGFTTCLSADAVSLRKRLHDVMNPRRKMIGCLLSGVLIFLLIFTSGWVAVAYDDHSGGTLLFGDISAEEITYSTVTYLNGEKSAVLPAGRCEALTGYLSELSLVRIPTDQSDDSRPELRAYCVMPDDVLTIRLHARTVTVSSEQTSETFKYYCFEEVDWEYLSDLLRAGP